MTARRPPRSHRRAAKTTELHHGLPVAALCATVLCGDRTLGRRQFGYIVRISPSRRVAQLGLDGRMGQEIDFAGSRPGTGTTINLDARLNPTNHLAVSFVQNQRWVNVDDAEGERRRLFIARVSRIRGTYTFTSRLFVRGIAQYVSTDRDPGLYASATTAKSGTLSGQALLSYKLNWQSVMFIGYGDDRELTDRDWLEITLASAHA